MIEIFLTQNILQKRLEVLACKKQLRKLDSG